LSPLKGGHSKAERRRQEEEKRQAEEDRIREEKERQARLEKEKRRQEAARKSDPQYLWESSGETRIVRTEVQVSKTGFIGKTYEYQTMETPIEHRTNSIGMKFVRIPGRDYHMGIYPVTQREWKAVMGDNPSHFKGDALPVESVSVGDCEEFIAKLNQRESDQKYRLPSEEEWEQACQAGNRTKYCFGDDKNKLTEYAWYSANSGSKTHEVGLKKPNAWGLHDMHGNVWEWTSTASGSVRVFRGGSWGNTAESCTSACRLCNDPEIRGSNLGLRLVRSL